MISGYSWMPFPILRYALFFIFGILISEKFSSLSIQSIFTATSVFIVFIILSYFLKKSNSKQIFQGLGYLLLILCIGMFVQKHSEGLLFDNQGIKLNSELDGITGIISSGPKKTPKTERYLIQVNRITIGDSSFENSEKIILYLKKSDEELGFKYGDKLFLNINPSKIPGPKNPEDFDYAKFMKRKGYEFQIFAKNEDILLLSQNNGNWLWSFALDMRNHFQAILKKNIADPNNFHIAEALLLGQKDDLPADVRSAFSDAGAIHVLAVSGLHVGIIYQILIYVLSFLKRWKFGSSIIFIISVFVLFCYALITGFSPSVSRAVIMFSVLALSKLVNKRSNIYNNLSLAALAILIINPMLIFDLGFQLSFLAVFSIVFFYPYLTRSVEIKYTLLDKAYKLTAVSLAAQIGTFPITIYYFHQFPNLFFLSNFIVIPFAGIILCLGMGLLSLNLVPVLKDHLSWALEISIKILNKSVFMIQDLPFSVTKDIYFDHWHLLFTVLILSTVILILVYKKARFIYAFLSIICIFSLYQWVLYYSFSRQSELILFSTKCKEYLVLLHGRTMMTNLQFASVENSDFWKYSLSSYKRERAVKNIEPFNNDVHFENDMLQSWFWKDQIIIKPKVDCQIALNPDWVIIDSNNAKMVLESDFNPIKGFILANNIPYFIRSKIIEELMERNLAFHDLKSEGALVLK